jgi:hypothetical protein
MILLRFITSQFETLFYGMKRKTRTNTSGSVQCNNIFVFDAKVLPEEASEKEEEVYAMRLQRFETGKVLFYWRQPDWVQKESDLAGRNSNYREGVIRFGSVRKLFEKR